MQDSQATVTFMNKFVKKGFIVVADNAYLYAYICICFPFTSQHYASAGFHLPQNWCHTV